MLKDITIRYASNPIGLDEIPDFSWKIESQKENVMQQAYQIQMYQGEALCWDTEKRESDQSTLVMYDGIGLLPMTAYHVKITVWDNQGEVHEGNASFETGLQEQSNWKASWITHDFAVEEIVCPAFSKQIDAKEIENARFYATALGVYDIFVDGKKVGDSFLAPGWTSYHNRLQYQTYDVTEYMQSDKDSVCLEVILGNGWYKGYLNGEGEKEFYGDRTAFLGMLKLEYKDGSVQYIGTDDTWKYAESHIQSAEIYHGETQDYTLVEQVQSERKSALIYDREVAAKIISQQSEPIRITKKIPARELIHTPKGEVVIDFGQNMAGLVEVQLPEINAGCEKNTLIIRHAETLDKEGNFYTTNLRTAKSTDIYIYGEEMVGKKVMPHFTYHGFRYICIEGLEGEVDITQFTACAMHTDMQQTGYFSCDNEKINQLQHNIVWGQRSNFFDIPTDCPQRDERLGWTGDAQIFCATGSFNFATACFYQKWLRDVAAESSMEHGVPHLVPNIVGPSVGTAVWGDCATIIPWQMYESYGDTRLLEENYPLMKLWVDYIKQQCRDDMLWLAGFQRGDWLALDAPASRPELMSGGTDKHLVANVYYALAARIVRDSAKILGKSSDEQYYGNLYEQIVEQINDEYVTPHGRLVSETQTACALLLHFDLLRKEYRNRVAEILEENLMNHKNHLTTGFVGTAYLCHALTEVDKHSVAEEVFLQSDYPGWFYAIEKGATTIWERWNSILPNGDFDESGMNSLNHYSYGAIGDWLYQKVAGITPLEAGYKKIAIKPSLTRTITEMHASLESLYGTIESNWSCKKGKIIVEVRIPANTTAEIHLPEKDDVIVVGSGSYRYEYDTETTLEQQTFSKNSTFAEILDNPESEAVLYQVMPDMKDNPMIGFLRNKTIGEMAAMSAESVPVLEMLIEKLNKI